MTDTIEQTTWRCRDCGTEQDTRLDAEECCFIENKYNGGKKQ